MRILPRVGALSGVDRALRARSDLLHFEILFNGEIGNSLHELNLSKMIA